MIDRLRRFFQPGHVIDIGLPFSWRKIFRRRPKKAVAEKKAKPAVRPKIEPEKPAEIPTADEQESVEAVPPLIEEEPPAATGTTSDREAAAATEAMPEDGPLETYPVNEPFAYIAIENTKPPRYTVQEVPLTAGEKELLNELKSRLYDIVDIVFSETDEVAAYLRNKVMTIIQVFRIELTPEGMEKIMYYITRDFTGYGKMDAATGRWMPSSEISLLRTYRSLARTLTFTSTTGAMAR
ncbi:MAG: hypothetical protein HYU85_07050 [Chloroflexi bacterium]|nr:hypothetical protein [Chloroflexota bacterium]